MLTPGVQVRRLQEGGLSFESAYMPHGESYDAWKRDENKEQRAEIVGRDYLGGFDYTIPRCAIC